MTLKVPANWGKESQEAEAVRRYLEQEVLIVLLCYPCHCLRLCRSLMTLATGQGQVSSGMNQGKANVLLQ